METRNLKPGTVITVTKAPFVTHYAIYIGNNTVIHATPKTGCVCETSLAEFENGGRANIVSIPTAYSPQEIVVRAKEKIGKPYRLLTQNCEHFVTEILRGNPTSKQLAIGGLMITGILIFLSRK